MNYWEGVWGKRLRWNTTEHLTKSKWNESAALERPATKIAEWDEAGRGLS